MSLVENPRSQPISSGFKGVSLAASWDQKGREPVPLMLLKEVRTFIVFSPSEAERNLPEQFKSLIRTSFKKGIEILRSSGCFSTIYSQSWIMSSTCFPEGIEFQECLIRLPAILDCKEIFKTLRQF